MNELKITKERILEAASKCSVAKETLKTLFPEAFQENVTIIESPKNGRWTIGLGYADMQSNYIPLVFSYSHESGKIRLNQNFEFSIEGNELKFKKL